MNAYQTKIYRKSLANAAEYGHSTHFWIRDNNPKEAGKRAKLAIAWANKALRIKEAGSKKGLDK